MSQAFTSPLCNPRRSHSTPTARFVEFFFPNKEPDRYVGLWTVWVHHDGYACSGEIGTVRSATCAVHWSASGSGFFW